MKKQINWESLRKKIQIFGNRLSSMIMPLIGIIIAWGILTAFFIKTGWTPVKHIEDYVVGNVIVFLIPTLIGFTGGYNVFNKKGGYIGAFCTFMLICSTLAYKESILYPGVNLYINNSLLRELGPQFLGAMILGPLSAYILMKTEKIFLPKIKAGFEMLFNNFYFAFLALVLGFASFYGFIFIVLILNFILGIIIAALTDWKALPLTSLIVEPAKPLFLNNAINHGVFTPLGTAQSAAEGKSILFYIESNPGPGMGILLATMLFDKNKKNKSQASAASVVHFFGGIHEVYFPFILLRPLLVFAAMAGGATGVAILQIFDSGAVSAASPGSVIALFAVSAHSWNDYTGLALSITSSLFVSLLVSFFILKFFYKEKNTDLNEAISKMNKLKGKDSNYIQVRDIKDSIVNGLEQAVKKAKLIVFACDAGMGSSAMGASVLRKQLTKIDEKEIKVTNTSLSQIPKDADIIVTQKALAARARLQNPNIYVYEIDQFLSLADYAKLLDTIKIRNEL
jgi:mannitol PTS system EIICBA or EIICB component